ncbi:DUF6233 domain-containing protein [Streptomyces sp. NPDC058613]|uniref:DUF6233 domain-containing protein n=1 Tax=Streptomyces sp. NPDC058613 TaxID=3346556 RepID=UPI00365707E3
MALVVRLTLGCPPFRVHAGDCRDTAKRCAPLSAEEARQALAEGVPACPHCRSAGLPQ